MVRAIAMVVLLEAARRGEYRASFHGFRIQAARQRARPPVAAFVEVKLCVTWDGHPVELEVMRMEPQEASATLRDGSEAAEADRTGTYAVSESVWWIESTLLDGRSGSWLSGGSGRVFHVGCVSPVDARYASPFARKSAETGQIS